MMGYWSDDPSDWPASAPHERFDCGLDNARWCDWSVNRTVRCECRPRPTRSVTFFIRCHRVFLIARPVSVVMCDHAFSLWCNPQRPCQTLPMT